MAKVAFNVANGIYKEKLGNLNLSGLKQHFINKSNDRLSIFGRSQ